MKTKTPKVIWKQLTIRVPVEVHRALKVRAAEEGRSLAIIIEGLVRGYLAGTGDLPSAQLTIREKNGKPEFTVWAPDGADLGKVGGKKA